VRFYGCGKNFSQKSSRWVCPHTSVPQGFWAQSQHRMKIFLKIKKAAPASFLKQALPRCVMYFVVDFQAK
jgi:hypothetical protein